MKAILAFHAIDDAAAPVCISRSEFVRELDALERAHVAVVPLEELAGSRAPAVALTFDDGFADFGSEAWPELRRRGLPARGQRERAALVTGLKRLADAFRRNRGDAR